MEELWDIFGGVSAKSDGEIVGSTMDYSLPANLYGQEYQWSELGLDGSILRGRNAAEAVGLGLAIQCASVKARDIAKAEMLLWKRGRGRSWSIVEPDEHWLAAMLSERPNDIHSWTEFWRMVILHLEVAQNAYVIKDIRRDGTVTELLPWMPGRTRRRVSEDGRLFYEFAAYTEFETAQLGGASVILPASRVIHLRGRMWDGLSGLSNAVLGNPIFELLGAINSYQTNLFGNDGQTPLVFETDRAFEGEQANAAFRRLKDQLAERTRKLRTRGDPILLEAGLKAKSVAMNSDQALTTGAFNQQVLRVCGLMEVPPSKIYALESIKYDNQAALNLQYAADCLIPITRNIAEKFRNELLPRKEWGTYWPEHDETELLQGDPASMAKLVDSGLKNGALEINEARVRYYGVNPIPGGDVRMVPVNMALVDRDGRVIQAATGQAAPDQNEPEEPDEEAPETEDDEEADDAKRARLRVVA
ncbi:phage portal protein [Phenylobacterium sp. J426]|uniref:phage portal protein n=1 Tax=Phenylobacterium sp. J426 TaxID=2898439 RepID=UPI0021518F0F|nr:phage portal protein [Phenylobacterium sp. J426]MCR5875160.1 phage portal protein [Phenylobacterium sp. J426]